MDLMMNAAIEKAADASERPAVERKHAELVEELDRLGMYINDLESRLKVVMGPALDFGPAGGDTTPEQSPMSDNFDSYIRNVKVSTNRIEHVLRRLEI